MAKWIDIGSLGDYPPGSKTCLDVDGRSIVVCRLAPGTPGTPGGPGSLDGGVCALVNICPHAGLPLGEGELTGAVLTCPFHGYAFNVATGRNIDYPDDIPVARLPVRVVEDRIEVEVDPE